MVLPPIPDNALPNQEIDIEASRRVLDSAPRAWRGLSPSVRIRDGADSPGHIEVDYGTDIEGHWHFDVDIQGNVDAGSLTWSLAFGLGQMHLNWKVSNPSKVVDEIYSRRRARVAEPASSPVVTTKQFWARLVADYEKLFTYRALEADVHPDLQEIFHRDVAAYWDQIHTDPELTELVELYRQLKSGMVCRPTDDGYQFEEWPAHGDYLPERFPWCFYPEQEKDVLATSRLAETIPERYQRFLRLSIESKVQGFLQSKMWLGDTGFEVPVKFSYGDPMRRDAVRIGYWKLEESGLTMTRMFAKGVAWAMFEDWPNGSNRIAIMQICNRYRARLGITEPPVEDCLFFGWHGDQLAAVQWWCDEVGEYEQLFSYRTVEAELEPERQSSLTDDLNAYQQRVEVDPELRELVEFYQGLLSGEVCKADWHGYRLVEADST